MNDQNDQTVLKPEDRTVLRPLETQAEYRACPFCGERNPVSRLLLSAYTCGHCQKEVAHIDYAQSGAIRGIFGWMLSPGDVVLNRYQIKSVLGKGGFGAAYLADDLDLSGKHRALKEIPVQMFDEYETSLLSRLDHPAIPDIIDRRTVDGMCYLVLKFGGSSTLASARRSYPGNQIPLAKLLPWIQQLCEVLVYLHEQNPPIIHRDLKPGNILLDENERIMLIDFGIAKEVVAEDMTRTLGRAASLHFSPPEQVMGTGTDVRADIFALGATFYALLTGCNPPPVHERVAGKALKPPSEFVNNLPQAIEDAILRALELNMNNRHQSIREFAAAMAQVDAAGPSQPAAAGGFAERTLLTDSLPPSANMQSRSIKFTPDGVAINPGTVSDTRNDSASQRQGKLKIPLIAAGVCLAAVASGWFYLQQPKEESVPETAPPPLTERIAPNEESKPVQAIPAVPPVPAAVNTATQPPPAADTPPLSELPVKPDSADNLPEIAKPQEPAARTAARPTSSQSAKAAAPAKNKPKRKQQPPDEITSTPQQSWVIIPGSTKQTH
ncbi:serine/threonine protein kinase [Methylomonas rivi]|uniref:non-specific serine/threonine protein kinase n=1 Tax=Methylomonas rivi TaxID=2952226 RepID=A0ABT1UAX4_9GAMM|nr:serine/threonine-protein kinase [Methylomonas sp. WSC-6]MCQ8130668.1 protein kinase [Methylomonas sp. WSC-6]